MLIDLTINALDNAFEIINKNNGSQFSSKYVAIGKPVALNTQSPNTEITISGKPGTLITGECKLTYNRLDVNEARKRASMVILKKYHTFEECLLNLASQLNLHHEEIILDQNQFDHKTLLLDIITKPDSLLYQLGGFQVRAIWQNPIQLSQIVSSIDLNGFHGNVDSVVVAIDSEPANAIAELFLIDPTQVVVYLEDETYDPYGDTILKYQIADESYPRAIKVIRPNQPVDISQLLPVPNMSGFELPQV